MALRVKTDMGELIERENLQTLLKTLRAQGKKIVTTNGCFDILHIGHVRYLKKAKSFGDVLIIAMNSDVSTRLIKGPTRPINNENDRAEILNSLYFVDYVVMFDETSPEKLLVEISPDVHTKGADYTLDTLPEAKAIMEAGGRIEFIDFVEGKSTTSILDKLSK